MRKIFGFILGVGLVIIALNFILSTADDAAQTVHKEYKASALLKKYESFKDLSSAIDAKRANIEMYQSTLKTMSQETKDDKFYYQQTKAELMGIIGAHNQLCAEYNSAMSKFNYRFTNRGDLPATNLEPLPREYKPYINNVN